MEATVAHVNTVAADAQNVAAMALRLAQDEEQEGEQGQGAPSRRGKGAPSAAGAQA